MGGMGTTYRRRETGPYGKDRMLTDLTERKAGRGQKLDSYERDGGEPC